MAYIEVHQALPSHRKIMRLRRLLKIEPAQAVGHMVALWCWALDNAQDGDLSSFEADEIAEAAMWRKDPDRFYQAIVEAGFIDEDNRLHDWYDYAGRLMDQREHRKELNRVRKQRQRTRDRSVTADAEEQDGHAGVTRDRSVTAERDKRDSHTTTVPYRTVPYQYTPKEDYTAGGNIPPTNSARARVDDDFGRCMGAIMDRLNPSPSSTMVDDVKHFLETLDADVIVWAVNTAADENKTGWSYVKAILNRCKNSNLTTMTAVWEHERQRMKRKEAKQGGTDFESDSEADARWGIKYSV